MRTKRNERPIQMNDDNGLILRNIRADRTAYEGFVYPALGERVRATEIRRDYQCGGGIHGLLWGEGTSGYLYTEPGAIWLVLEAPLSDILTGEGQMTDKCKYVGSEGALIVYEGTRDGAVEYITAKHGYYNGVWAKQIADDGARQTAGYKAVQTAGDEAVQTAGDRAVQTAGDRAVQTAGYEAQQTAGYRAVQTAGYEARQTAGY